MSLQNVNHSEADLPIETVQEQHFLNIGESLIHYGIKNDPTIFIIVHMINLFVLCC